MAEHREEFVLGAIRVLGGFLKQLHLRACLFCMHRVPDADHEFPFPERLHQVIANALVEQLDHQLFIGLRRQQQDGDGCELRALSHRGNHLDAADMTGRRPDCAVVGGRVQRARAPRWTDRR